MDRSSYLVVCVQYFSLKVIFNNTFMEKRLHKYDGGHPRTPQHVSIRNQALNQ